MTDEATACPICTTQLTVQGDALRAFGTPSSDPVAFGSEVIALECGHRMHRSCLVQWLNTTLNPTCPMCRTLTDWKPSLSEERRISRLMETSWKQLSAPEQGVVKWTWILAGIFCVTDPLGYLLVASLLMVVTPPVFYAEMALFLAWLKKYVVGAQPAGLRILLAAGVASIVTVLTVTNHEVLEMS